MRCLFYPFPKGVTVAQFVGNILKHEYFFQDGYIVKKNNGFSEIYFVARGLQEERHPHENPSMYIATSEFLKDGRIKISIRRESEWPLFYDCPPQLFNLVKEAPMPDDLNYVGWGMARKYREQVIKHQSKMHKTSIINEIKL